MKKTKLFYFCKSKFCFCLAPLGKGLVKRLQKEVLPNFCPKRKELLSWNDLVRKKNPHAFLFCSLFLPLLLLLTIFGFFAFLKKALVTKLITYLKIKSKGVVPIRSFTTPFLVQVYSTFSSLKRLFFIW